MCKVDVVVVCFNSASTLRACVGPLAGLDDVRVIVVDNASTDDGLSTIGDLPVKRIVCSENGGFARGCNEGWRAGAAPFVLLLNPDAALDQQSLAGLVTVLEGNRSACGAGPRIVHSRGPLHFSQRRFPRLRSTFAQALFLHRAFPRAGWADEVVRDERAYAEPGSPEWISGACILLRRDTLEELGGLDEGFFLYCEDTDLCRRMRDAGYDIRFEPDAVCVHDGGGSAPRTSLLPVLAASRIRYAQKHYRRTAALIERLGIILGSLTHMFLARGGKPARAGHARSLRLALSRRPEVALAKWLGISNQDFPARGRQLSRGAPAIVDDVGTSALRYGLVTPARDECENLRRLAASVEAQTVAPSAWIIVDDGSVDETFAAATELAKDHRWIRVISSPATSGPARSVGRGRQTGRDVVAFHAGLASLDPPPDVAVKLDADVSFGPDYFERLLSEFVADPSLGIASGSCYEHGDAAWNQTFVTGGHVRGASRAYRWACLQAVLPLDEHIGWDGIDEIKASLNGWRTATLLDIPFYHHRKVGQRDGTRRRGWAVQGRAAYYMGYRFSYLLLRAIYQARREVSAVAMPVAYLGAAFAREPRCPDLAVRSRVRSEQRLRSLPLRAREAGGRRP